MITADECATDIDALGHASYLSEDETSKPIISFTATAGSARLLLARVPEKEQLEGTSALVEKMKSEGKTAKVVDLYLQSVGQNDDPFRAFLSGWTALEIFVHSLFKHTYGPRWFKELQSKIPSSATSYLDRVEEVMSDKHRLLDKFVVIASLLSPATAEADIADVRKLKEVRDGIIHQSGSKKDYPAEQTQRLLRRYLRLHLEQTT